MGSVRRKSNCQASHKTSAFMKRCLLNLKMDHGWQKDSANHAEATNDIADYLVGFYNGTPLHSKLGNLSPSAFKHQLISKKLASCPKSFTHCSRFFVRQQAVDKLVAYGHFSSFLKVSSFLPNNRRHKHCCPLWPVTVLQAYAQCNA